MRQRPTGKRVSTSRKKLRKSDARRVRTKKHKALDWLTPRERGTGYGEWRNNLTGEIETTED